MKNSTQLRPKLLIFALSWGFFLLTACAAHANIWDNALPIRASTPTSGFQLLITAPASASPGAPVMITITLTNTTKEEQFAPFSDPTIDYSVTVTRLDGSKANYTLYGQEKWSPFMSMGFFSERRMAVMPGQSEKVEVDLTRNFDMTLPGDYKIQATRDVWDPDTKNLVRLAANASIVKIIPQKPAAVDFEPEKDLDADQNLAPGHAAGWKIGDKWKIQVDILKTNSQMTPAEAVPIEAVSKKAKPASPFHVMDSYILDAEIVSFEKRDGHDCARLSFRPSSKSPSYVSKKIVDAFIDQSTGELMAASLNGKTNDAIQSFEGHQVLIRPIDGYAVGFPVDIIPRPEVLTAPKSGTDIIRDEHYVMQLSRETSAKQVVLQEKLTVGGLDWFRVTQTWQPGARWWTEYCKEDFDNQIAMRGRVVDISNSAYGAPRAGLSLEISLENTSGETDKPMELRVALRNSSDKPVTLNWPQDQPNLLVQVLDAEGQPVPATDQGKAEGGCPPIPFGNLTLPAHSIVSTHLTLGAYYDISAEGKYWVFVQGNQQDEPALQNLESVHLPLEVARHWISARLFPPTRSYLLIK